VFLSLTKFRLSPNQNIISNLIFLLMTSKFEMFDRSTSHFGMSFQDFGLVTLFLNNHNDLKIKKALKILDLFGLKILIKINF
jgi:hypothetical protein